MSEVVPAGDPEDLKDLEAAERRIRRLVLRMNRDAAEVCEELRRVKLRELYKAKHYESFAEWAAGELGFERSDAFLHERVGTLFSEAEINRHGPRKLDAALNLVRTARPGAGARDVETFRVRVKDRDGVTRERPVLELGVDRIRKLVSEHRQRERAARPRRPGAKKADQLVARVNAALVKANLASQVRISVEYSQPRREHVAKIEGISVEHALHVLEVLANAADPTSEP